MPVKTDTQVAENEKSTTTVMNQEVKLLDSLSVNNFSPKSQRVIDSPGLWILAFLGSISLHVLVFWWLSSSKLFGFWVPLSQSAQDNVVVELVDVPDSVEPQKQVPKSEPALAKPNPSPFTPKQPNSSTTKKVVEKAVAQVVVPKPSNSNLNRSPAASPRENQPNTPLIPKPIPGKFLLPPTPPKESNARPWDIRPEKVELREGESEPLPEIPNDKLSKLLTPSPSPTGNPTPETSPVVDNSQPQLFTFNIQPLNTEDIQDLRKKGTIRADIPQVLPKYEGENSKQLEINVPSGQTQIFTILVSLIVDQYGKFQGLSIIDPNIPEKDKSAYEQELQQLFKEEKFVGGSNNDGSRPEKSNLYVRVTITPMEAPTNSSKNSP
ncbi:hypothetical protein [Cylindrospermopsis raciborskii]|uniref:hypothetical protein n=1 Tax=Cylindrospermopsis raciborskii TaxID=77022 RepID=UPI0026F35F11|nr:hypothetical protein [Cylindrospermopsis raciborskii]